MAVGRATSLGLGLVTPRNTLALADGAVRTAGTAAPAHLLVDVSLQADAPMVPAGVADAGDGGCPGGTRRAVVVVVVGHRSGLRIGLRRLMPAGPHRTVDRWGASAALC